MFLISHKYYEFKQRMVIKTRSVKYMPFSLSLATFVNSIVWCLYALMPLDPYILVT